MAVLDPNEIFYTAYEPKQANRFILYMDGFPSYIIKQISCTNWNSTFGNNNLISINIFR